MRNRIKGNYTHENAKKALRAVARSNGHRLSNFIRGENHDVNYYATCQNCKRGAVVSGVNSAMHAPCKGQRHEFQPYEYDIVYCGAAIEPGLVPRHCMKPRSSSVHDAK